EALRLVPLDHRARLKVALCLAAYGKTDRAITTLRVIADTLSRRGYFLSAIGACRDALGLDAGSQEIARALTDIHGKIYGLEGRGRSRVPPPSPPAAAPENAEGSLIAVKDVGQLIEKAAALATTDPDGTAASNVPPTSVPLFSDLSKDAFISLVSK